MTALTDTTYAVGFGGGNASPEIPLFWPVTATNVAVTGQK
jgi:hypothetical protein